MTRERANEVAAGVCSMCDTIPAGYEIVRDAIADAILRACEETREECARVIEEGQESESNASVGGYLDGETRRYLSPRRHGNLAGLAFAAAIRARGGEE